MKTTRMRRYREKNNESKPKVLIKFSRILKIKYMYNNVMILLLSIYDESYYVLYHIT